MNNFNKLSLLLEVINVFANPLNSPQRSVTISSGRQPEIVQAVSLDRRLDTSVVPVRRRLNFEQLDHVVPTLVLTSPTKPNNNDPFVGIKEYSTSSDSSSEVGMAFSNELYNNHFRKNLSELKREVFNDYDSSDTSSSSSENKYRTPVLKVIRRQRRQAQKELRQRLLNDATMEFKRKILE